MIHDVAFVVEIRYFCGMRTVGRATGSLALFLLSVGSAGCDKDDPNVDSYVDGWSKTVCDAVVECNCEYPGGSQLEHCLSQLSVGAKTQAELLDVDGLTFDGGCAQRQIDEIGRIGCGVFEVDPDAQCEAPCKPWYGPMHAGGTCTTVNGYDNCNQGLVCDNGVCVHPCAEPDLPQLGEACSTQFGCDEGLWCDAVSSPLLPVCATLPAVGEPCLPAELGFACGEDLVCDMVTDPASPLCAALPGLDEECPVGVCAEDFYCDNTAAPAVCTLLPALGELCPFGVCASPNVCDSGLCVDPPPQVCGYYGGVPEGLDDSNGSGGETDITTTITAGESTGGETGGFTTGITGPDTGELGDCCLPNETPGCDDIEVVSCVCQAEPSCCSDPWSSACVEAVSLYDCGAC